MKLDPEEKYIYDAIKPFVSREKTRGSSKRTVKTDLFKIIHLALDEVFDN